MARYVKSEALNWINVNLESIKSDAGLSTLWNEHRTAVETERLAKKRFTAELQARLIAQGKLPSLKEIRTAIKGESLAIAIVDATTSRETISL